MTYRRGTHEPGPGDFWRAMLTWQTTCCGHQYVIFTSSTIVNELSASDFRLRRFTVETEIGTFLRQWFPIIREMWNGHTGRYLVKPIAIIIDKTDFLGRK
ncbi:hypothetical protein V6N13_113167 [Hibiscus sabdariffa]|uniref:Uncharacterized protein n=1 Tax=Hibiscus sabdariffa TaxID=183260 RepID=A0ABR2CUA9_9ROSI